MARQPKQIHIFLYRRRQGQWEYAIFQRSDLQTCWQGVCGGLEDAETFEEGARRELFEEAGIGEPLPMYPMECVSFIPTGIFSPRTRERWGKDVVVIPMHYYAMPYDGPIKLSEEHTDVQWLPYRQAYKRLYFEDQRIALYELNERLLRGLLPDMEEKELQS